MNLQCLPSYDLSLTRTAKVSNPSFCRLNIMPWPKLRPSQVKVLSFSIWRIQFKSYFLDSNNIPPSFAACTFYSTGRPSLHIHQLWLWQAKARISQNKWKMHCLGKSSFKGDWCSTYIVFKFPTSVVLVGVNFP